MPKLKGRKGRPGRPKGSKTIPFGPAVNHVAVRIVFTCSAYPEKHPGKPDIYEHIYTFSKEGNSVSERDILQAHLEDYPHDELISYKITHSWTYTRDSSGRRFGKRKRIKVSK